MLNNQKIDVSDKKIMPWWFNNVTEQRTKLTEYNEEKIY